MFMGILQDTDQDEAVEKLHKRISRLEAQMRGENKMSPMLRELVGRECVIEDYGYNEYNCRVIAVDEEWVKINEYEKKGESTKYIRIMDIKCITLK